MKGEYDRAIIDYDAALRLDPDLVGAYLSRGLAYTILEDYVLAIADFDDALRIDPNLARGYYHRGSTLQEMGDQEGAERDCRKARELGYKPRRP